MARLFVLLWLVAPFARAQYGGLTELLSGGGPSIFPELLVIPRHSGKPDTRWRDFEWRFNDRSVDGVGYRLYFYEGESWSARFLTPRIDEQIRTLIRAFDHRPGKRFNYLLFTSPWEFQQANLFRITEGVQGITSTTEPIMAIPYWGEPDTFQHISLHEMVHQFQVQLIGALADVGGPVAMRAVPLWFIEGMAEYLSLGGLDREARMYLRDQLLHPSRERNYRILDFFEPGQRNFVDVYKVGQAKVAYLEKEFGSGTAVRLLRAAAGEVGRKGALDFVRLVREKLGRPAEAIERGWRDFIDEEVRSGAGERLQSLESFDRVEGVDENLDYYDVSPDGLRLLTREVDPLTGVVSLRLYPLDGKGKPFTLARDDDPSIMTLYLQQAPSLALSNDAAAYVVGTPRGPELEIARLGDGEVESRRRIRFEERNLLRISTLAFSPDGRRLAFVGLGPEGWENVYVLHSAGGRAMERITEGYYGYRTLSWGPEGILLASNRTASGEYNLFRLDPETGAMTRLTEAPAAQGAPDGAYFQSWESGASQIHRRQPDGEVRLTDIRTGIFHPRPRGDAVYALGFLGGRYRLYRLTDRDLVPRGPPKPPPAKAAAPWRAELLSASALEPRDYRPVDSVRLDNLMAQLAGLDVLGIGARFSDLMRNYSATAQLAYYRGYGITHALALLTSQEGRSTWALGAYQVLTRQTDSHFLSDERIYSYLQREFGALGIVRYPLSAVSYVQGGVRVGGVNRFDFSAGARRVEWESRNPGPEAIVAPVLAYGYDAILYELFSGPLRGHSLMVEAETTLYPKRGAVAERLRLDLAYYHQIAGRMVLALQGLAAGSWGGEFRNPFFVNSNAILRAYPLGDERQLGNYVLAAKAELRFPIGTFFGFPPLRGLLAVDYGSVFAGWDRRHQGLSGSASAGLALNVPPLALNFIVTHPALTRGAPVDSPVIHFTLGYLYW